MTLDNELQISIPSSANLQLADPALLQFYTDQENRIYWIQGEIDDSCLDLVARILNWNREDEGIDSAARKSIRIFFNSPGGGLDTAETICSVIELSKTPVIGIAMGQVASAASLIFLSCHTRYALKNSCLMLHKGSCNNLSANYDEIQAFMEDYREQMDHMIKFYIAHTSYTEEEINQNIKTDWYIRGEALREHNLITDWVEDISILL